MRIRLTVGWLTFRARATSDESSRKVSVMIRKRWAEKKAFFFDMSRLYQDDIWMSNKKPHRDLFLDRVTWDQANCDLSAVASLGLPRSCFPPLISVGALISGFFLDQGAGW
mgnify:CR=1 FL=1